ncbi:uncharacterized protein ASCRUDRAFT_13860 [Ascoidea rubescens DSM 1968]|uniref:Uncharacterized protein n=1 Tax=Ascoidea rubescens DSM 1968 TaxID=1344418 RepID=A0A1D2VHA0_9ASCO|nr:hypothetical protein ASCRUDRAFT_13860 [Ascoidea rubescens DSM 1968]ODV60873.1 hypothetical protein ASCRUDRAFT_13860 [Ascoidea rubescens DSM 1968]
MMYNIFPLSRFSHYNNQNQNHNNSASCALKLNSGSNLFKTTTNNASSIFKLIKFKRIKKNVLYCSKCDSNFEVLYINNNSNNYYKKLSTKFNCPNCRCFY